MIVDPGVIRYSCKRNVYFLAKHTLFKNKFMSWIFRNANVIPVYRRHDDPSLVSKNEDSFNESYKLFEEGKCIAMFPEGISLAVRAILKIKTGAARISLNAEIKNDFNLNLQIIPLGINYSAPSRFKSDVYAIYGKPIFIKDYKELARNSYKQAINEITNEIENSLLNLTTNLSFIELEDAISHLEVIYKNELFLKNALGDKEEYDDFEISKEMIKAVEWYIERNPPVKEHFVSITTKYMRYLERLKLDDRFIVTNDNYKPKILPEKPIDAIWFFLQFPFYLYGLVNNIIPYIVSISEVNSKNIDEVEIAQYKYFIGGITFTIFYIIQVYLCYVFTNNSNVTLIYFLSLIPFGNFALNYHNDMVSYLKQFRFFRIFSKRSDIIFDLQIKREEIIEFIKLAKRDYSEKSEI